VNKTNVYKQLAAKIRRTRMEKGITQENLAYSAGLNRAYIGYIENANRHPSIDTVNRIAKVLNVPLYQLFKFP